MRVTPRPYQVDLRDRIRDAFRRGRRAPLVCSPTGSGKTVLFSDVTEGAVAKGNRVTILVHRKELLQQCSDALDNLGIHHGLISPDYKQTTDAVQVASIQALVRRLDRTTPPDLLVFDEAHHATAGMWATIAAAWPKARKLGVTATACRSDGKGLGDVFDELILGPTVGELIGQSYLCKPIVYAPPTAIDIAAIKHKKGEFDTQAAAEAMDKASICGDVIAHYRKLCAGKPAIVFCATVAHAHHVAESFRAAGLNSAALDGTTDAALRRGMIRDLGTGGLNALTSCDVVSEGTDIPAVFGAILLRPTESTGLYLQQVGRALRPYPGKPHAVILDHVGNCERHGFPDDDREWSLDGSSQGKPKDQEDEVARMKMCVGTPLIPGCYAMNPLHRQSCEQCGAPFVAHRAPPKETEGELVELTEDQKEAIRAKHRNQVKHARSRAELEAIAKERGYSAGWVEHMLKGKEKARAAVAARLKDQFGALYGSRQRTF